MMETVREIEAGGTRLRLVKTGQGYVAVCFKDRQNVLRLEGSDPDALWEQLQTQLESNHVGWYGYGGAKARFLHWFAGGFTSPSYLAKERDPKLKARDLLLELAPLDQALSGSGLGPGVLRVFQKENLLYPVEKARLSDFLRGPQADPFVRASARLASGDGQTAMQELETILRPHQLASWTVVTYLPFLWRPDIHMFLKPETTKDFALRVGHRLARTYASELKLSVYADLLDLAGEIRGAVLEMGPRDMIDVQSFLWTVGNYNDGNAKPLA